MSVKVNQSFTEKMGEILADLKFEEESAICVPEIKWFGTIQSFYNEYCVKCKSSLLDWRKFIQFTGERSSSRKNFSSRVITH